MVDVAASACAWCFMGPTLPCLTGTYRIRSAVRAFRRSKLIEKYMAGGQARSEVVDLLMENKRQQMVRGAPCLVPLSDPGRAAV